MSEIHHHSAMECDVGSCAVRSPVMGVIPRGPDQGPTREPGGSLVAREWQRNGPPLRDTFFILRGFWPMESHTPIRIPGRARFHGTEADRGALSAPLPG